MNEVLKRAKAVIEENSLSTPLTEAAYILMALIELTETTREQTVETKRIADALEESNARLERIEKLEAREQLAEEKIRVANEVMRHWGQLAASTQAE